MDFDLGSISLDLDATIAKPAAALQKSLSPDPALDFSDFALPSAPAPLVRGRPAGPASWNWPKSSARSVTWKVRATCWKRCWPSPVVH